MLILHQFKIGPYAYRSYAIFSHFKLKKCILLREDADRSKTNGVIWFNGKKYMKYVVINCF